MMNSQIDILFKTISQETDNAVNIKFGDYKYIWLPKSLCKINESKNLITIPHWLVKKKGL